MKPFELCQFLDVLWLLIYYNQKYKMRTHTGWDGLPDFVDLNIKGLKILAGKKKMPWFTGEICQDMGKKRVAFIPCICHPCLDRLQSSSFLWMFRHPIRAPNYRAPWRFNLGGVSTSLLLASYMVNAGKESYFSVPIKSISLFTETKPDDLRPSSRKQ